MAVNKCCIVIVPMNISIVVVFCISIIVELYN